MEPRTLRIFFSHAHEDNALCQNLVDKLRRDIPLPNRDDVFIDVHGIHPGDQYMNVIQAALVDRPIFIIALTSRSVHSNFVRSEVNFAISQTIKFPDKRRIISLLLDPCDPAELAPLLMQFQLLDFTQGNEQAYQSLLNVLRSLRTGKELPDQPAIDQPVTVISRPELEEARRLRERALASLKESRWDRALVHAEEGLELAGFANDVGFREILARAYIGESKWIDAENILQHLLKDAQFDPALWSLWAEAQQGMGEFDNAVASIDKALRYETDDSQRNDLLLAKRKLQITLDDYEGALKTMKEAGAPQAYDESQREVYYTVVSHLTPDRLKQELEYLIRQRGATLGDWLYYGKMQPTVIRREQALAQIMQRFPNQSLDKLIDTLQLPKRAALPWEQEPKFAGTVQRLQTLGFTQSRNGNIVYFEPPTCRVDAGQFTMGSDIFKDGQAFGEEEPAHTVPIDQPYLIGTFPVTVAEYAMFVRMDGPTPRTQRRVIPGNHVVEVSWKDQLTHLDHPVVCVEWEEALAYTRWLSQVSGKRWRLPTEAEWEKAARWDPQRQVAHIYPWNNHWDAKRCNTRVGGPGHTTPIDAYANGVSPWGVWDMSGNVWEWTSSIFLPYPYTENREERDDVSKKNQLRVLRGGAWLLKPRVARAACRNDDNQARFIGYFFDVGFRLVCDIDAEPTPTTR